MIIRLFFFLQFSMSQMITFFHPHGVGQNKRTEHRPAQTEDGGGCSFLPLIETSSRSAFQLAGEKIPPDDKKRCLPSARWQAGTSPWSFLPKSADSHTREVLDRTSEKYLKNLKT